MIKFFSIVLFISLSISSFSQSRSEILLNKASEIFSKDYSSSFQLCCQAEKISDAKYIGDVAICKARYYLTFTDYENTEIELNKAIQFFQKVKNYAELSHAYDLYSILLKRLNEPESSKNYLLKAYQYSKKSGDTQAQIKRLINLSHTFVEINDLNNASYYLELLNKFRSNMKKEDQYYLFQNTGTYFFKSNNLSEALKNFEQALAISISQKMIDSQATILMLISSVYEKQKNYKKAEAYVKQSYQVADKYNLIYEKSEALTVLIAIYENTNNFTKAFELQKEYIALEKEILNAEKLNRISAIQNRLILTEKENIINKQNSKIARQNFENTKNEVKNQRLIIVLIIGLIVFSFVIFIYFRTKKLNQTIQLQKLQVEEKNTIVESQNKDIKDSILYAERIQQATLPPIESLTNLFPESFVFYRPKDILSGDFYWIEEKGDHFFIAAADCTGHGVPGALISIINNNLLNKAIIEKGLIDPAEILNSVNLWLTESLHQTSFNSKVKDGMDVSLIVINKQTLEMQYSGAYAPIYIFRNSNLLEYKGNKFPVGMFIEEVPQTFTSTFIQLEKNDQIYLFSDGFPDQFGGENNKKYKYNQFKSLFQSIHTMKGKQQLKMLEEELKNWKGENEQTDDILIVGVRV